MSRPNICHFKSHSRISTEPGGHLQWHEAEFPGWQVIDESLAVESSKFPRFIEIVDELLGLSSRFFGLRDLVAEDTSFVDVVELETPLMPWLVEYENTVGIKAFLETLQTARKVFATSQEKLLLVNEAQKAVEEFLKSGGMITYKMKVITARKK